MNFGRIKKCCAAYLLFLLLPAALCFSQYVNDPAPSEIIKKYKSVLKYERDPVKAAEAHYMVGYALESLGKETEATAEYLKIIINYPDVTEFNKKAEERLAGLYSGFSQRSREISGDYELGDAEKDPAIFFAYIKALYENHRNMGQYDKALSVLRELYDMEPNNPAYLVDMGDIYLHGYNDTDKAIFHFEKALELFPDDPRAYAGIGRAYEKKEDLDKALQFYTKAAEIAPASPAAIYGLRRLDGIRLANNKRLIKDWYFIGPFDNREADIDAKFPPEEKIDILAGYASGNKESIKWFRPFDYNSFGYVDLNEIFTPNDFVTAYALTYAYSQADKNLEIRLGAEDSVKLWLNDEIVITDSETKDARLDDKVVTASFKKGWNKVFLKLSDTWGSWGFYFRVTDPSGRPVDNIVFDPLRNTERVNDIYGKLKRQKRFRITRIAAIYGLAFLTLGFGMYLMVSNIIGKIKINRMKEDFISSVSHELKTPIAAVRMLTETLKMGKIKNEDKKDEYYGMIIRESDRLTRFITKILDFSKLEKGGKVFYFENADIVEVSRAALDIFKDETQDPALNVSFNSEEPKVEAEIDKDAIFQVVFNLIDNGYKYSGESKNISVSVKRSKKNALIEVSDKGLGIPKDKVERVFDKFYRVERDTGFSVKGSGLGLAFVKSVVDAHGGKVAVESEVGKGTKFVISLPLVRAQ